MLNLVQPPESPVIDAGKLAAYLSRVMNASVTVSRISRLGDSGVQQDEKAYGYGVPLRIDFEANGRPRSAVLHTMKPNAFGHEHRADRAAILLWSHDAFNRLPKHVHSINVGAFDRQGGLVPLQDLDEVFLLTDYVQGREYGYDLLRLRDGGELVQRDFDRCDALCDYLLKIHATRHDEPSLYVRRIRELVGHGECIMGLIDSYPADHPWITPARLCGIEQRAAEWRWKLRGQEHRLAQVHGDFHPWNILFGPSDELHVVDRSRGEWGEPADDVTSLTMNYVFESLQRHGRLDGAFALVHQRFWERYVRACSPAQGRELLQAAPPFLAWRALVLASPVWYPQISDAIRRQLFNLIDAVLASERFEPERVNEYLDGQT